MTEEETTAATRAMAVAISKTMTGVSDDANVRLNALATLYVETCFFGGLGIGETANGVARIYQGMLDRIRASSEITESPTTETTNA